MTQYMSGKDGGALKTVNGRLDVDRSLQRDRFASSSSSAGPSQHAFQRPPAHQSANHPQQVSPTPFDLTSLRQHLSPQPPAARSSPLHHQHPIQAPGPSPAQTSDWASSFASHHSSPGAVTHNPGPVSNGWHAQFSGEQAMGRPAPVAVSAHSGMAPWQRPPAQPLHYNPAPRFSTFPATPHYQVPPSALSPTPIEQQTAARADARPQEPLSDPQEVLARTASSFVSQLQTEDHILRENPKLANSNFMKLVSGLGDRNIVVEEGAPKQSGEEVGEGAKFVERSSTANWAGDFVTTSGAPGQASSSSSSSRRLDSMPSAGHLDMDGPAVHRTFGHYTSLQRAPGFAPPAQVTNQISQSDWDKQFMDQEALIQSASTTAPQRRKSVHFDRPAGDEALSLGEDQSSLDDAMLQRLTQIPGASSAWQEDLGDDLDFDEETFYGFNGPMQTAPSQRWGVSDNEGWKSMDDDWSKYMDDTRTNDRSKHYLFQAKNPYQGLADSREMDNASPTVKGVLELEAEVQNDPTSWEAWYALGLKQQENEREDQAILALSKVIQLEPDHRPTYLALAVSYTNEGEREAANTMLERWIDLSEEERRDGETTGGTYEERRERLVERLIDMARASPEEVDADIQVALGVIFNASAEYDKAEDCFAAALSVKPDDWLLYNRLGATLANSGRSAEAMELYHRALALHPNFVRAHFNLGISHANMAQYPQAAQSILNALRLQHTDATEGYAADQLRKIGSKGVTSSTLWNTLRMACQQMGREDLVALANARDLSGFPMSLDEAGGQEGEDMVV